jgi:hypothetical protein
MRSFWKYKINFFHYEVRKHAPCHSPVSLAALGAGVYVPDWRLGSVGKNGTIPWCMFSACSLSFLSSAVQTDLIKFILRLLLKIVGRRTKALNPVSGRERKYKTRTIKIRLLLSSVIMPCNKLPLLRETLKFSKKRIHGFGLPQKACNLAPPIVEESCWKDRFCDCI